jgi:hypothetical protein
VLFPSGIKRPGPVVDQSHPFSTEVKNSGAIPPLTSLHDMVFNSLSTRTLLPFPFYSKRGKGHVETI